MAARKRTESSRRGRHRHSRKRAAVVLTSVAGLFAAASVGAAGIGGGSNRPTSGCTGGRALQVAAAAELVPAVEATARRIAGSGCLRIKVVAAQPVETSAALAQGESVVDVWIPDSSMWLPPALPDSGPDNAVNAHIASSPVVLAVAAPTARRPGFARTYEGIARTVTTAHPITLRAASPGRSATSQAALFDLHATVGSNPTQRGRLAALLRSADLGAAAVLDLPRAPRASGADGSAVAYATTERQIRAANAAAGRRIYRAVHPEVSGTSMDYPYVVLTTDPQRRSGAEELLSRLTDAQGRATLARLGFRTGQEASGHEFTAPESRRILGTLAVLDRPSRLLALVDVSGSMGLAVPGAAGATRIDLARTAIKQGLNLLPHDAVAGLWRFSAELTPSTDYEQVAPLTPLTPRLRPRLASAIDSLRVNPGGGTGLYASVLAAVRYVRASYDPSRVNSVVVLSDGKDEYATAHGIGLAALLKALRADANPKRPVGVIAIAYGPDSDSWAMRRMARVTGGALYTSTDPRDLPIILREAIGRRLCAKDCE